MFSSIFAPSLQAEPQITGSQRNSDMLKAVPENANLTHISALSHLWKEILLSTDLSLTIAATLNLVPPFSEAASASWAG